MITLQPTAKPANLTLLFETENLYPEYLETFVFNK